MESLLDHLQEQGYYPQETTSREGEWYDLTASGIGTVRICIYPDDAYSARIVAFDATMACEWDVRTSPDTPDSVIIATLVAAERELAGRRGSPVTPAQVSQ